MDDFTTKEIAVAVFGSAGIIGGLISAASYVSGRVDKWRERKQQKKQADITESTELKKLKLEADEDLYERFKDLYNTQTAENARLTQELKECRESETSPKLIAQMYRTLRIINGEIEAMNLLFMDEEKTQIFARRFNNMQKAAKEMEDKLP